MQQTWSFLNGINTNNSLTWAQQWTLSHWPHLGPSKWPVGLISGVSIPGRSHSRGPDYCRAESVLLQRFCRPPQQTLRGKVLPIIAILSYIASICSIGAIQTMLGDYMYSTKSRMITPYSLLTSLPGVYAWVQVCACTYITCYMCRHFHNPKKRGSKWCSWVFPCFDIKYHWQTGSTVRNAWLGS